jgi:hypothetical protein
MKQWNMRSNFRPNDRQLGFRAIRRNNQGNQNANSVTSIPSMHSSKKSLYPSSELSGEISSEYKSQDVDIIKNLELLKIRSKRRGFETSLRGGNAPLATPTKDQKEDTISITKMGKFPHLEAHYMSSTSRPVSEQVDGRKSSQSLSQFHPPQTGHSSTASFMSNATSARSKLQLTTNSIPNQPSQPNTSSPRSTGGVTSIGGRRVAPAVSIEKEPQQAVSTVTPSDDVDSSEVIKNFLDEKTLNSELVETLGDDLQQLSAADSLDEDDDDNDSSVNNVREAQRIDTKQDFKAEIYPTKPTNWRMQYVTDFMSNRKKKREPDDVPAVEVFTDDPAKRPGNLFSEVVNHRDNPTMMYFVSPIRTIAR